MDLLIEKGDKRTYLSRYKVITTSFEESSPSVKRNNTQIQYRNGNVDFGGWNEDKTIDYVGYYRADDLEDEEYLRERIYALLSDPEGYYITQLKNDNDNSFERPGETSGDYFDKQVNRPSHKRFYVYASSLESELVGSYGGHVLYKISAKFTTMKLPYGESVPRDLNVKPNVPYYGRNLLTGTGNHTVTGKSNSQGYLSNENTDDLLTLFKGLEGQTVTLSVDYEYSGFILGSGRNRLGWEAQIVADTTTYFGAWYYPHDAHNDSGSGRISNTFVVPTNITSVDQCRGYVQLSGSGTGTVSHLKLEKGSTATPWIPSPSDPEYNEWYINTYYNTKNLVIPYAGTVICNQLEQGFGVWFKSSVSASALDVYVNDVKFTYNGSVAVGDEFFLTGYEYGKNGTNIVKDTNKAYFKLFPNSINRISTSLKGKIIISGFQNLYA